MHIAFVLFADVAFKVGATLVAEIGDHLLHLRVRRAVELRNLQNVVAAQRIGADLQI